MEYPRVDSEDLTAYYDPDKLITHVTYRGPMTADLTIRVYRWIAELAKIISPQDVHGGIFDFRDVTNFESYSLSTVMNESRKLNMKMDFSHVPVALIVSSGLQEQMVRVVMKVTPQDHRKAIVHSEEEAWTFIEEWNKKYATAD
ncbi:MAG: hypothetical protein D6712_13680 [Chloroflexi bacterium]|nr:MAG: hypothetical protein D6712_13680 [Chloroflexota bacterium]